jgi:hypothetical protein
MLVKAGCNLNLQNHHNDTALLWAAFKGHAGIVDLLMAHNADPTLRDERGMTAAAWAEEKKYSFAPQLRDYERARNDKNGTGPKPLPAPQQAGNGWSVPASDVVIRTVIDPVSDTRIKNIFDFAAHTVTTEIASGNAAPQIAVAPLGDVNPGFRAEAEKRRAAGPQAQGLM